MKRWHVVQVYAGYEEVVKNEIERMVQIKGAQDHVGTVLVPAVKTKQGSPEADNKEQQLFPGYVLVEMDDSSEAMKLVTISPRVLKSLGTVSQREVDKIVSQTKGEIAVGPKDVDYVVGSEVEIMEGPFAGFVGIVDKVDVETDKLTVMVSIFGRMTPVELGFHQVKR